MASKIGPNDITPAGMRRQIGVTVDDLKPSTLKRLVMQLLAASEGEEEKILEQLAQREEADKERNDLANLVEEKRGKPAAISERSEPGVRKRMA